jgi:hypothetical protein
MQYRLARHKARVKEIGPEPEMNTKGFWRRPEPHVIEDPHKPKGRK